MLTKNLTKLLSPTTQLSLTQKIPNINFGTGSERRPKMEITMRTPYRTIFKDCSAFNRIYFYTYKGLKAIGNGAPPNAIMLPPGLLFIKGLTSGDGNFIEQGCLGEFMHSGGYAFIHPNNTIDVNLMECVEKEKFSMDMVGPDSVDSIQIDTTGPTGFHENKVLEYALRNVNKKAI